MQQAFILMELYCSSTAGAKFSYRPFSLRFISFPLCVCSCVSLSFSSLDFTFVNHSHCVHFMSWSSLSRSARQWAVSSRVGFSVGFPICQAVFRDFIIVQHALYRTANTSLQNHFHVFCKSTSTQNYEKLVRCNCFTLSLIHVVVKEKKLDSQRIIIFPFHF